MRRFLEMHFLPDLDDDACFTAFGILLYELVPLIGFAPGVRFVQFENVTVDARSSLLTVRRSRWDIGTNQQCTAVSHIDCQL